MPDRALLACGRAIVKQCVHSGFPCVYWINCLPIEDPDYKQKCMHLGTYPPIVENLLKDEYKAWRRKMLKEIFRVADATAGGVVSVAAMCKQGKHRSTATAWYVEHALKSVGYRVGFQHLSWLAQDSVWCQRGNRPCEQCSRSNPDLEPLRLQVVAEALSCHQSAVEYNLAVMS